MTSVRMWSSNEASFLKENYDKMTAREIGQKLGRTIEAVRMRSFKLGLTKRGKYLTEYTWTKEDSDFLSKNYWCMSYKEVAKELDVKERRIQHRIDKLHLTKEPPDEVKQEAIRLLTETNFPLDHITSQIHLSERKLRRLMRSFGITRKQGIGWRHNSLNGFKFTGSSNGKRRQQFMYAYKNTCWDCRKTLLPMALIVHEDWSILPVKVYVLCRSCHKKRHGVRNVAEE